jgi:hypothetical protein
VDQLNNPPIQKSREELLAAATAAHKKRSLDKKFDEALAILKLLEGSESLVIDLNTPEIAAFKFSEAEKDELLELFILLPVAKESKAKTMHFLERIEKFGKHIDSDDAERLLAWSNRYAEHSVSLKKTLDEDSLFTLNTKIRTHKNKLNLSEYEVKNWVNM